MSHWWSYKNMEAEREANRIRNTDFAAPQTKPSDWFTEKLPVIPRGFRPPSYKASAADTEIKKNTPVAAPPPPSYDVKPPSYNSSAHDPEVKDKQVVPESLWALRRKMERERTSFCGSYLFCACLEPFSRCFNEPHYHSKGNAIVPTCCGHCDSQKMTCWCSKHDWPQARMAYVGEMLRDMEEGSRKYGGFPNACRRGYKKCPQPCSHTFAEWYKSIGGWFWYYDGKWAGPHLGSPVDDEMACVPEDEP